MASGIEPRLRAFLVQSFGFLGATADLGGDVDLLAQGILDSTGVLEVVMFFEKELGLTVDDSELVPENFGSIQRMVAFVERKQRSAA
jgi:acyl carrier protein